MFGLKLNSEKKSFYPGYTTVLRFKKKKNHGNSNGLVPEHPV